MQIKLHARAFIHPPTHTVPPLLHTHKLTIILHINASASQTPVCNGRLCAVFVIHLRVQVRKSTCNGVCHHDHGEHVQHGGLEVVVQGTLLLVLCDEVVLHLGALLDDVSCDEALEVFVSHVGDLR